MNKSKGKNNKNNKLKKMNKSSKYIKEESENLIVLNGPINYFKLSNGDNQINIFMDFHAPIQRQRKCDDYESKDVDKYFNKVLSQNIETSKNTLDFFLEINPTSINQKYKYYTNGNYLASVRKMFSKLYNDKYANITEDKMPEQQIRLHYMDIRDYSSFNELKRMLELILAELEKTRLDNLNLIINELISMRNILVFIDSMIKSIITNKKDAMTEKLSTTKIDFINLKGINKDQEQSLSQNAVFDIGLYQILQKILLNYKDSGNKDNVINLFSEHYMKTSQYLIDKLNYLIPEITEINKIIDDYIVEEKITFEEINSQKNDGSRDVLPYYFYPMDKYKKIFRAIMDEVEEINHLIVKMGVIMTDCYFLRRLIDNPKINKSIVYTGAYHSVIYLWFLVKHCNYNIDDYYYLKSDITKDDLVDIIKKSDYLDIMQYIIPDKVNQCIKIKEL